SLQVWGGGVCHPSLAADVWLPVRRLAVEAGRSRAPNRRAFAKQARVANPQAVDPTATCYWSAYCCALIIGFLRMVPMLRVMLVDDTQKDVSLLKETLVAAGYEVVAEEKSPAALLERVGEVQPDVIIIDTN